MLSLPSNLINDASGVSDSLFISALTGTSELILRPLKQPPAICSGLIIQSPFLVRNIVAKSV